MEAEAALVPRQTTDRTESNVSTMEDKILVQTLKSFLYGQREGSNIIFEMAGQKVIWARWHPGT